MLGGWEIPALENPVLLRSGVRSVYDQRRILLRTKCHLYVKKKKFGALVKWCIGKDFKIRLLILPAKQGSSVPVSRLVKIKSVQKFRKLLNI